MPLGIDPKVDFAFKMVFGNPEHTEITIHFLNAVLAPPVPITWVEILNPIQGRDRPEEKLVILDILARDSADRHFNIEMQTTLPIDLPKRLTYYNCLNYVRQIESGQPYANLRPAVSICVLDRVLYGQTPEYHLSFRLRCDQQKLVFTNDLEFHLLELPKFAICRDDLDHSSPLDRWLYFLRHAKHSEPKDLYALLKDTAFCAATEVLEMISRSPDDRQFYEARMKFLNDEQARIAAAKAEGKAEGIEHGVLVGKIQLIQQLLGDEEQNADQLGRLGTDELLILLSDLQQRLRSGNP